MSFDLKTKIVLIGNSGVGKTSLLDCYRHGSIPNTHTPTVGAEQMDFMLKVDEHNVRVCVWDTAGQDRYRTIGSLYYRDADGCICVFDVTNPDSFDGLSKWIEEFQNAVGVDKKIVIAANKCDLKKQVDLNRAISWADQNEYLLYQTSALTNFGVADLFEGITGDIIRNKLAHEVETTPVIDIEKKPEPTENSTKKCC